MKPDHIDQYNIDSEFSWKKFPIQDNKMSILLVYDENDVNKMRKTINKLLKVFPERLYYDNEKINWLSLPTDSQGFKAPYLEKVIICSIKPDKHTLILDLDHSNLEDPKEFEEFPIILEKPIENKQRHLDQDIPIIYPLFSDMDNKLRENIEITKITEGKTFITHIIAFGDYNKLKSSYYEKFDVLMFTNEKIAVHFCATRTSRIFSIKNEDLLSDKIFMVDTRIMKNNMCFYTI